MIRPPPRSTPLYSSAASDVYRDREWVNSNMLLDSDSKISHKEAMKYEQKEELKKNLLESNSETVIVEKKSIGKIEKVNKE